MDRVVARKPEPRAAPAAVRAAVSHRRGGRFTVAPARVIRVFDSFLITRFFVARDYFTLRGGLAFSSWRGTSRLKSDGFWPLRRFYSLLRWCPRFARPTAYVPSYVYLGVSRKCSHSALILSALG